MTHPARPLRVVPAARAPGPAALDGAAVLDEIGAFVSRFNAFPDQHCVPTLTLWYAHTHAAEHFYVTPRLILSSAEPGSGKTRVLEVAQYLVHAPEMTISASTAALFRMVNAAPITILFDEVDAIFNPKNGGNYEDLRAMLNAGYKRSATIARCVGDAKAMKVQRFHVYAPVALAGIAAHMPDTITTRAITVHMRRRAPDERVEPFKTRRIEAEAEPLRDKLSAWVETVADGLDEAEPHMPEGVTDRSAEIWEPLIALADAAGGHWPDTARAACAHFVASNDPHRGSLGIRLLADLRDLYTHRGATRLPTSAILEALRGMEEAPWNDLYGKPLDARRLAKELGRYGVEPTVYKADGKPTRGYLATGEHGLADAWKRYLPADTSPAP
ncbi:DUF3631 domain-containing protein [Amycolatopsis pithecellobii]|uniref:DUF3631 domain-containing protein n=1 Tax=Amycolatopsis pithecellobii TaxID=664692 RepID=A0A6N7ZAQ2_9PSEU|nr:DUF3631 domain-containing protein [Amycolatopsis pithecellobii]MTD58755.1 DUF3631 domain-containing protein [Amycolatopsis pithecellobii]